MAQFATRPLLLLVALLLLSPGSVGQVAADTTLTAPDGTIVTIDRDAWGVPTIVAETSAAVFYAQGFAVAQDRLFQMETFWRAATGRLAELIGQQGLAADRLVRTVTYTHEERMAQFEALPDELQTMIESFVAGVNAYIALAQDQPAQFMPFEYTQFPLTIVGMEEWDVSKAVAVMQFFIRRFGEAGGQELQRLSELMEFGEEWFNVNRPVNDPTAPTTIPLEPARAAADVPPAYQGPAVSAAVIESIMQSIAEVEDFWESIGIPRSLGSYAAVVAPERSATGNVMLLGVPQMGVPEVTGPGATNRAVTWESELLVGSPDDAELHIAGMTVPGIPGVILGRTLDFAWTFTSGVSDNVDTFVIITEDETLSRYLFNGEFIDFDTTEETINVLGAAPVPFTRTRTVHGPVYGTSLDEQQAFAYRYAFWAQELAMATAMYGVWQANTVEEIELAIAEFPVSFNFFLAHRDQSIHFWHLGQYPQRPGDADPRLPLMGDGTQEWVGLLPFDALPSDSNPAQGYFVNWNNKPAAWWDHGDIMPWWSGAGRTYDGVLELEDYVVANLPLAFDEMKGLHAVVDLTEYPGTYQQLIEFDAVGSRAENLVPPGQSAFFNAQGQPSPHIGDQFPLYQVYEMKPFTFLGEQPVTTEPGPVVAEAPVLLAPYPNPTGSSATVRFSLPADADARLEVVDLLGRVVAVLTDERAAAGVHDVQLATDRLATGTYFVRLLVDGEAQSQRLTIIR